MFLVHIHMYVNRLCSIHVCTATRTHTNFLVVRTKPFEFLFVNNSTYCGEGTMHCVHTQPICL